MDNGRRVAGLHADFMAASQQAYYNSGFPPTAMAIMSVQPSHQPQPPQMHFLTEQGPLMNLPLQQIPRQHPPVVLNTPGVSGGDASPLQGKRRRGRPRKYGTGAPGSSPPHARPQANSAPAAKNEGEEEDSKEKKRRGRPPGSGKKQQHPSGDELIGFSSSAGAAFTPHVILVAPSENIIAKIEALAQQLGRSVCILSVTGRVTGGLLRPVLQNALPIPFHGDFQIVSMSGCQSPGGENPEKLPMSGDFTICLCDNNSNSVRGGVVVQELFASDTVQVIVGSFLCGKSKPSKGKGKAVEMNSPSSASGSGDGKQEMPRHNADPLTALLLQHDMSRTAVDTTLNSSSRGSFAADHT